MWNKKFNVMRRNKKFEGDKKYLLIVVSAFDLKRNHQVTHMWTYLNVISSYENNVIYSLPRMLRWAIRGLQRLTFSQDRLAYLSLSNVITDIGRQRVVSVKSENTKNEN